MVGDQWHDAYSDVFKLKQGMSWCASLHNFQNLRVEELHTDRDEMMLDCREELDCREDEAIISGDAGACSGRLFANARFVLLDSAHSLPLLSVSAVTILTVFTNH